MAKKQVTTTELIKTTQTTITETTIEERTLPVIEIIEGKVFCTSQQVALSYKKEHFHVLRDIETHIAYIKNSSRHAGKEADMYLRGFYEVEAGFGKVKKPMYYLNRSGFVKLIANYQGLDASDTTMDYFEAFDKMEAMLFSMHLTAKPIQYLSNAQVQELKAQVDHLARHAWMKEVCARVIWNRLRFLANADTQLTIPADQFEVLKAELRRMEHVMYKGSRGTDSLIELMNEIQEYAYRDVLCLGTPLSGTTHKDWRKKFGSLIPQGMGWRKAALILDELKPELEPA